MHRRKPRRETCMPLSRTVAATGRQAASVGKAASHTARPRPPRPLAPALATANVDAPAVRRQPSIGRQNPSQEDLEQRRLGCCADHRVNGSQSHTPPSLSGVGMIAQRSTTRPPQGHEPFLHRRPRRRHLFVPPSGRASRVDLRLCEKPTVQRYSTHVSQISPFL